MNALIEPHAATGETLEQRKAFLQACAKENIFFDSELP